MLNEFKPSLFFLLRFLGIYFAGNILYGVYVGSFGDSADSITYSVAAQATALLNFVGYNVKPVLNRQGPTVFIETSERIALSVYEGCNGINVMILFVAFVVAFGGPVRKMGWFLLLGLLIIHMANLARISFLFFVSEYYDEYFYYIHKYFFTAIIYLVVFALWVTWVVKFNVKEKQRNKI